MSTYIPPIVTVDGVIFQILNNQLSVLLIRRTNQPFKGQLALPGGYNGAGQTTRECLASVLEKKAGVMGSQLKLIEQLYTFDTVARDPRGHAVSVTYMGLGKDIVPSASDSTQQPEFYPVDDLPELAYDHADIIRYARERLAAKITYTNAVFALLDPLFTLTQLQSTYEAIFGRELDKRNFRKKFLSLDLIRETDEYLREGAHRPARLFAFKQRDLEVLSRSFD
ncbi:MAG: NUDIX domain-containing protein [Candidatus Saccharimonadales bacterium]